jgi:hypothetical protein
VVRIRQMIPTRLVAKTAKVIGRYQSLRRIPKSASVPTGH